MLGKSSRSKWKDGTLITFEKERARWDDENRTGILFFPIRRFQFIPDDADRDTLRAALAARALAILDTLISLLRQLPIAGRDAINSLQNSRRDNLLEIPYRPTPDVAIYSAIAAVALPLKWFGAQREAFRVIRDLPVVAAGSCSSVCQPFAPLPNSPNLWHLTELGANAPHKRGYTGKGVTIGIVDGPVCDMHPELHSRVACQSFVPDFCKSATAHNHVIEHGTSVAILAAGKTLGVAPEADVLVAECLSWSAPVNNLVAVTSTVIAGLEWLARESKVRFMPVINLSYSMNVRAPDWEIRELKSKMAELSQVYHTLFIAAMGNDGARMEFWPAASPGAVGVGAYDANGISYVRSNYSLRRRNKPEFMAPGVCVCSACPAKAPNVVTGTSFAAPLVSGAAALVAQRFSALNRDPKKLRTRLKQYSAPKVSQGGRLIRALNLSTPISIRGKPVSW